MPRNRDADIKAPDGYLLGGLRKVRKDGTVLFQRGWWQCPLEWAGETIWVHEKSDIFGTLGGIIGLEAWPPGARIWSDMESTIILERTERKDALPAYRDKSHIAWYRRNHPEYRNNN